MITSFKGYADDIFHVISSFYIYRSKFDRKSYKPGRNCWTPHGLWGCFFQLQGPLVFGGARLPPSVKWSAGQGCRGKVEGQGLGEHCPAPRKLVQELCLYKIPVVAKNATNFINAFSKNGLPRLPAKELPH